MRSPTAIYLHAFTSIIFSLLVKRSTTSQDANFVLINAKSGFVTSRNERQRTEKGTPKIGGHQHLQLAKDR